ncbi:M81 family metallopeptidase [Haladaptatus caseinilyticus]|uniref:M81 family metallopeptidase n=1 Tax=Haladaptatus caseinilyticus TaxID=2993314 RepID=UPI00224A8D74|nr:M81 family metallopeptidase [Haladaptatus caseinilyticus]
MKIAVGTMSHETNTFAKGSTGLGAFSTAIDTDLLKTDNVGRSLGGIVEKLEQNGVEIVPTIGASALPSATVEREAFEWVKQRLVDRLDGEDIDGVCLDLHGSMFVEGEPDPEGNLLLAVRDAVGSDVPITSALDMHATITGRMVEQLDGIAGYRTAPHTDVYETGARAANLLLAAVRGKVSLAIGWNRLPMILSGEQSESEAEPMRTLIGLLREADKIDGIYDANYFLGFPWADTPHMGCHSLVTGDASGSAIVDETAADLAREFWQRRHGFAFTTEAHKPSTALNEAIKTNVRPVVIADTGDIPGAGASENATNLLSEILNRTDLGTTLIAVIADADSYDTCCTASVGTTVSLSIGRVYPDRSPLEVTGTLVRHLNTDAVRTVLISIDDGTDVVISDRRTNVHRDPEFVRRFEIEPTERDVVVLKSGYLSPAWKEVAAKRLFALTPGETNQRLTELPYERIPRPIFPLDSDTTWSS